MPRIALASYVPHLIAASTTCGLLAAFVAVTHGPAVTSTAIPAPVLEEAAPLVRVSETAAVRQAPPPRAPSKQLLFVFQLGNDTYVKLSDDEPKHGKRVLVDDASTVAEVAIANLPAKFRGWESKTFELDGGCVATVRNFAVVTRATGTPGYAGLDDENWTVDTAARAGVSQLAARLETTGCAKALYARDASLASIVELERLTRPELVDQAKAMLLTTEASDDAQAEWTSAGADLPAPGSSDGSPAYGKGSWLEHAQVNAMVQRHPTTGQIFVGIHAAIREGCGGPDINVWSLFRVGRGGTLVLMHAAKLDTLYSVERMFDLDNDGAIELFGQDWLGLTNMVTNAKGEPENQLAMAFHGCPC